MGPIITEACFPKAGLPHDLKRDHSLEIEEVVKVTT